MWGANLPTARQRNPIVNVSVVFLQGAQQRGIRRTPRIRHPRKDIILSSNQPPLSAQRTTPWHSGPQLAMPFGFNMNKGEYRRSAQGELQPL